MIRETQLDRENQRRVLRRFADLAACDLAEFPSLSEIDACFLRDGRIFGIGEAKRRNNAAGKYPTLMIDAEKVHALQALAVSLQVWAVLIVRFDDMDAYAVIDPQRRYPMRNGGRTDRGDSNDIGMMAHVPITDFFVIDETRQAA